MRRGEVSRPCSVCGRVWVMPRSQARETCSDDCLLERRRVLALEKRNRVFGLCCDHARGTHYFSGAAERRTTHPDERGPCGGCDCAKWVPSYA